MTQSFHRIGAALLVTVVVSAGCIRRDLEIPGATGSVAIGFNVAVEGETSDAAWETRAAGEIASVERIYSSGFGVFGCYTGLNRYSESNVSSDFMHNQQVVWSESGVWEYEPVKYWPNSEGEASGAKASDGTHFVSFFGYAPYSDGDASDPESHPAGYCIPSFCNPRELSDPWLLYRVHPDPEKQVDLLYSVPLLDRTKPETGAKLPFVFRHALSCAGDHVRLDVSEGLKEDLRQSISHLYDEVEIVLTDVHVDYMLTPKARLCLWNRGEANWQTVTSEGGLTLRRRQLLDEEYVLFRADGELESSHPLTIDGKGIFYIPLDNPGQEQYATVVADYVIRHGIEGEKADSPRHKETTLYLREYFHEGKKLDINISFIN